jgi:hypothetical protein
VCVIYKHEQRGGLGQTGAVAPQKKICIVTGEGRALLSLIREVAI